MSITEKLYRLSWGGRLFTTDEWSNTVYILSPAVIAMQPDLYAAALSAFHSSNAVNIQNQAFLDFVKLNEINPVTAEYASLVDSFTHVITPGVAGFAATSGPAQISMAVGLTTVAARGRGHAGRFFLPIVAQGIATDGRTAAATANNIVSETKTLINAINAVTAGARVVIYSKAGQLTRDVNGIRCGRVYDTQRRRRSSLDEDYQKQALA